MIDTFRFEQDLHVRVNSTARIVTRSDFLNSSTHIQSLIITGDPGSGKTIFILDLCDSINNYELILVNQLSSITELWEKIQEIPDSHFLLIDGIL